MASPARLDTDPPHMWKQDSIEERAFAAALVCLEGHYQQSPVMGPQSIAKVMSMISKTLEKTHTYKDVREVLSKNLRIWIWLRRAISAAICDLNEKSLGVRSEPFVATRFIDITTPEVTALIIKNYVLLKEALHTLNKLMHIARNLLVTTNPEIPQNLSATINFDHEVIEAICLCVNVLSKGIDGEMPEDDASRAKLNDITELYKKVLVTSLQQAHNWIAKNDRNKMTFWYRVFIESPDVDLNPEQDDRYDMVGSTLSPRCLSLQEEVRNWIKRNTVMCRPAAAICQEYFKSKDPEKPDLWFPHQNNLAFVYSNPDATDETPSTWNSDTKEKFTQDWQYGRVSYELDTWWSQSRLPNTTNMDNPQCPTEILNERIRLCEENLMSRYAPPESPDDPAEGIEAHADHVTIQEWQPPQDTPHYAPEYDEFEEDGDDDDSYGEGPMTGLLTEVPNILDPKQIEALHMIIKACILDSVGSGPTRHGESLQQARCRIMLATECGRNLLREMLVFIAVWEKDEQSLIFQISSQIVQALHESCLIHHAWEAVRSPKDIMSPAQTVLLRLITYLARTAFLPSKNYNPDPDPKGDPEIRLANPDFRLSRMLHDFYTIFRHRIAPECIALMRIQGEVRNESIDPADFPVDNWDLERAKDGLVQFLDFLYTIADIYPLRQHLIDYDAVYDLLKLLEALDLAVEKAPIPTNRRSDPAAPASISMPAPQPSSSSNPPPPPPPPPPPLSEPPHEFPWAGIKGQVLSILAALLQPPPGQSSPGNPAVQLQIVKYNGIVTLLNCCLYDDNNRFCRERTQLCLKWLMDGSPDAAAFLQNLISANQNRPQAVPGGPPAPVRIDGVPGEVKIQVRSASAPATAIAVPENSSGSNSGAGSSGSSGSGSGGSGGGSSRVEAFNFEANLAASRSQAAALARRLEENKSRNEELVNDLLALTVSGAGSIAGAEAHRGADPVDADETEDEDFI
ncbi:putative essential cytoplasmic protein [Rosellinia necatrix]|uniref:Ataxin-10 homolog n=1 Tax=Rosellinia necatrix TaxID=77044 RepID=A0A1W2TFH0_ROSNE|nr:putative essential cytoplasmic protein [Rosellinia necatrix]